MSSVEVWLPVVGYDGLYEISNHGRVRNAVTGKFLKPSLHNGYAHVAFYRDNDGGKTHYLHTVVLKAFCGPPPFPGFEGCHNDGDRANNALTNLRWGSRLDNTEDRKRHGRQQFGVGTRSAKLTDEMVREMRAEFRAGKSTYALAKQHGLSTNTTWSAVTGATWKHVEGAVTRAG